MNALRAEATQLLLVCLAALVCLCAWQNPLPAFIPPPPQLCRQFRAGNLERTEVDVNVSEGFVQRQFEPLAPAVAAND